MTGLKFIQSKITCLFVIASTCFFSACSKEEVKELTIGNNIAPYYSKIPTVLVHNYVNKLYIDLIGREPLDSEMDQEVQLLKQANLNYKSRDSLIEKLQFDETFRAGDSSYSTAYYNRLYELFKVKMLEGASDLDILQEQGMIYNDIVRDSMNNDWFNLAIDWEKYSKLNDVLDIEDDLKMKKIGLREVFTRLLDNAVYDRINMNTFNFIRASFNDLFGRFPTEAEFNIGFSIVEDNSPAIIFGHAASNKSEFISILVNSPEFREGIIRWVYSTLLARAATTFEIQKGLNTFSFDQDLPEIQKSILITDEYANF